MLNWNFHVKGTSDIHLMAVIQFKDGNVKGSYCHTPLLWLVCVLNPGSHPVSGLNNRSDNLITCKSLC